MNKVSATDLLNQATCPNCWTDFPVEDVKWIAAHEELINDYRLPEKAERFRPSRFDAQGNAIDVKGMSCQELACPHCHLKVPRSVLVFRPFFLSIAGTPSCGKSFYLASMIWESRRTLPNEFKLQISDSDGEYNQILNGYEEQLFFDTNKSGLTKLAKTDLTGDWYSTVQYDDQNITYPKPFYFDLQPSSQHFGYDQSKTISRLVCLYDNAGESFLPGADSVLMPVTRHLGLAESWLFCFDPTQNPKFRNGLRPISEDYQVTESPVTKRQELVLNEMIGRIRRHSGLSLKEKSKKPLIVVCTKFDAWQSLLGELPDPWTHRKTHDCCILNLEKISEVSDRVSAILQRFCPEFHAVTKSLTKTVYYVPVSATGASPVRCPETGEYFIRTSSIKPIWCEVPLLLALAHRSPKLVRVGRSKNQLGK